MLHTLGGALPPPQYDRGRVRPGIVHIGLGGFARAQLAMYLHRLMEQGEALDWGICGVGVRDGDRPMRDVMRRQNGLYTLVLKRADGSLDPTVVGSVVAYLFAPDDPDAVIERLASPETRIVSLTITEGGYNVRDELVARARRQREEPLAFLDRRIFGDLVDEPAFTGRYIEALTRIRMEGVRRALEAAV